MQFVWFPCLVWKCVEWLAEMTWCDLQDSLLFSELQIYTDAESHQTQLGSHFWWPKSPPQSCSQDSCWLFWLWPAGRSNRLLPSTKLFDVDWLDWGKPIKTNHSIFWRHIFCFTVDALWKLTVEIARLSCQKIILTWLVVSTNNLAGGFQWLLHAQMPKKAGSMSWLGLWLGLQTRNVFLGNLIWKIKEIQTSFLSDVEWLSIKVGSTSPLGLRESLQESQNFSQ